MLSICELFDRSIQNMSDKSWDCIYIAIDWHGTISPSTHTVETSLDVYTGAKGVLRYLSQRLDVKLILFTSSYQPQCTELLDMLDRYDITFDFICENPEVCNTKYGKFDDKFYYDILLDDKAGFEPDDWISMWVHLVQKYNANI